MKIESRKLKIGSFSKHSSQFLVSKGFTLVEIMTAVSISLFLLAAVYSLSQLTSSSQSFIFSNYLNTDGANRAVTEVVKELRRARSSEVGSYILYSVQDDEIEFYTDTDNDGVVERVRYYLSGTDFYKDIIEPQGSPAVYDPANATSRLIIENVRNLGEPIFTYYNGNWPEDTTNNPLTSANRLGQTQLIYVKIRVNDNELYQQQDYVAESFAQIRMAKNNL